MSNISKNDNFYVINLQDFYTSKCPSCKQRCLEDYCVSCGISVEKQFEIKDILQFLKDYLKNSDKMSLILNNDLLIEDNIENVKVSSFIKQIATQYLIKNCVYDFIVPLIEKCERERNLIVLNKSTQLNQQNFEYPQEHTHVDNHNVLAYCLDSVKDPVVMYHKLLTTTHKEVYQFPQFPCILLLNHSF